MTPPSTDLLPSPPATLLDDAALFLDFDGTLVELADSPDGVIVPDDLLPLLSDLSDCLDGRLAIVSGRDCARLDAFGLGSFMRAGSHGLEILAPDAVIYDPVRHTALDSILDDARAFADDRPGVVIEPKPYSVGIHYRQAPEHADAADALADRLSRQDGLFVQRGKLMAEIRPSDGNKGKAIERVMQTATFKGHVPIFLGDDITDEDGFVAANTLGGHGIFVGAEGTTSARWRLDDVMAVHQWLRRCRINLAKEKNRA